MDKIPPNGSKLRILRDLIEPACGDHPAFLMAVKGEIVTLVEVVCERERYPLLVHGSTTSKGETFYIDKYEAELIDDRTETV